MVDISPNDTKDGQAVVIAYVHPLRAAKIVSVMYAIPALLIAPLVSVIAIIRGDAVGETIVIGVMLLVVYPICGFLGGAFVACLYNCAASAYGGFRIDLK